MNAAATATPRGALRTLAQGLAMGAADAVPGVSGGTVALLLGFYATLLEAVSTVLAVPFEIRTPEGRQRLARALGFLLPLGVGVLASYYVATKVLVGPEDAPGLMLDPKTAPYVFGIFAGLVLASAQRVWSRIPDRTGRELALFAVGALASWAFVGLPRATTEPPTWALLLGGAAAIGVMFLPGVSGSLLLVILGQYTVVASAVHDRELGTLLVFGCGLALGAATFVPVLRRLLARYPRPLLAILSGLMLGSLRAVWPWKHAYDTKHGELTNHFDVLGAGSLAALGVLLASAGGVLLVLGAEALERRSAGRERAAAAEG